MYLRRGGGEDNLNRQDTDRRLQ